MEIFNSPLPYQTLHRTGELRKRATLLKQKLSQCKVCPRHCEVDRMNEEEGFCQSGRNPIVSSTIPHFGEEPVLVGENGAGNVFFGSCNLRCVYCQNWQISHPLKGKRNGEMTIEELADRMIHLQKKGCHNINFVSPSHFVAQMVEAIDLAAEKGLQIPLVYNTNAYDDLETLHLLDGVIDIYLPDLKYSDDLTALKYSQAKNYVSISREAIQEMFRQVGILQLDENGLARRGMIIRHLILPNDLSSSKDSLRFISEKISRFVHVSLMAQYYPTNKAEKIPLLSRKVRESEYAKAVEWLEEFGLENGWVQEFESAETYRPDFNQEKPFNNLELGILEK